MSQLIKLTHTSNCVNFRRMLTQDAAKAFLLSPLAGLFNLDNDITVDTVKYEKIGGRIYVTCDGMTKTLSEWSSYLGINRNTLYSRLRRGWDIPKALYTTVKKQDLNTLKDFFSALAN